MPGCANSRRVIGAAKGSVTPGEELNLKPYQSVFKEPDATDAWPARKSVLQNRPLSIFSTSVGLAKVVVMGNGDTVLPARLERGSSPGKAGGNSGSGRRPFARAAVCRAAQAGQAHAKALPAGQLEFTQAPRDNADRAPVQLAQPAATSTGPLMPPGRARRRNRWKSLNTLAKHLPERQFPVRPRPPSG